MMRDNPLRRLWERWAIRRERSLPLGMRGERVASRFLRRQGVRVFVRNYRSRHNEIDLIGRIGETVVFVEVKTRRKGDPALAVDTGKRRKVIKAAMSFLNRFDLEDQPHRFDIVAVSWSDDACPPQIEHWPDAFSPLESAQVR